jgi:hypothetical protein
MDFSKGLSYSDIELSLVTRDIANAEVFFTNVNLSDEERDKHLNHVFEVKRNYQRLLDKYGFRNELQETSHPLEAFNETLYLPN